MSFLLVMFWGRFFSLFFLLGASVSTEGDTPLHVHADDTHVILFFHFLGGWECFPNNSSFVHGWLSIQEVRFLRDPTSFVVFRFGRILNHDLCRMFAGPPNNTVNGNPSPTPAFALQTHKRTQILSRQDSRENAKGGLQK